MSSADDPLWAAIRALHARYSPAAADKFPQTPLWERRARAAGNRQGLTPQRISEPVPTGPTVPGEKDDIAQCAIASVDGDFDERAAILEYEGGLERIEAERRAAVA